MGTVFSTAIDGLVVSEQRLVRDERGYLSEIMPGGTDNALVKEGIRNIYLSAALGNEPRAGHYHHRQVENFFTISGAALWAFRDFRDGPTAGKVAAIVLADEVNENFREGEIPVYRSVTSSYGVTVPNGVYHVYWPLGKRPVRALCIASTPYDPTDYVALKPDEVEGILSLVAPLLAAVQA